MASKGLHVFPIYGSGIKPNNWNGYELGEDGSPISGWIDGKLYLPSTISLEDIVQWPDKYKGQTLSAYGVNPKQKSIIIDVDNFDKDQNQRHDIGLESLKRLAKEFNISLNTFRVLSKSPGSFHLYFAYPDYLPHGAYIKSPASPKLTSAESEEYKYPHIDIRADKAHVVGPTDEGPYTVDVISSLEQLDNLSVLPDSFIEQLIVYPNNNYLEAPEDESGDIEVGGRDDFMFRLTCKLKGKGLSRKMAEAILRDEYSRLEQPENDVIPLETFLNRFNDIFESQDYSANPFDVKMNEYQENLIIVAMPNVVYDIRSMVYCKNEAAKSIYSHHIEYDAVTPTGESKSVKIDIYDKWTKSNDRQRVDRIGYHPNRGKIYTAESDSGLPQTFLNRYMKKYWKPVEYNTESPNIRRWLDLNEFIWEENAEYALKFCASIIQNPEIKIAHMLILISELHGLGKDAFFKGMSTLLGRHNTATIQLENLEEKYNSYLQDNLLVLINESNQISDKKANSVRSKLKMYITADMVPIRRMNSDIVMSETFSNFIMFGNNTKIMEIEDEDNRMYPHINKKKASMSQAFMTEYHDSLTTQSFGEEVHSYMKNLSLDGFNARTRAPKSSHKDELVFENKSDLERSVLEAEMSQEGIFRYDVITKDSYFFMVNETYGCTLANATGQRRIGFLWRRFIKDRPSTKSFRMQRILLRTHPEQHVRYTITSSVSRGYVVKNFEGYNQDTDPAFLRRMVFNGLMEVTPDIKMGLNLSSKIVKELNDLTAG